MIGQSPNAQTKKMMMQVASMGGAGRGARARGEPATPRGAPAGGTPHPPQPGQEGC